LGSDESISMAKKKIIGWSEKFDSSDTKRLIGGGCSWVVGGWVMVVGVDGCGEEECDVVTRVELHDLGGGDGSIEPFRFAVLCL